MIIMGEEVKVNLRGRGHFDRRRGELVEPLNDRSLSLYYTTGPFPEPAEGHGGNQPVRSLSLSKGAMQPTSPLPEPAEGAASPDNILLP